MEFYYCLCLNCLSDIKGLREKKIICKTYLIFLLTSTGTREEIPGSALKTGLFLSQRSLKTSPYVSLALVGLPLPVTVVERYGIN